MRPSRPLVVLAVLLPALAVFLGAPPARSASAVLAPAHRISAVTVYPDRAQVTRTATLELPPGVHTVRFGQLPMGLAADSVRVRGAGKAKALIHGFELRTRHLGASPVAQVQALETRLTRLKDRERQLKDAKSIHARQLGLITSTAEKSGGSLTNQLALGKASIAQWRELLAFYEAQQKQEAQALRTIDVQLRALAAQRAGLDAELAKLKGFRAVQVREVPVTVEVTRGGTLTLEVSYVVGQARWSPAYDARLDADGEKLDWRYHAVVRQQTGEDWQDVQLKLSTALPAAGSHPPSVPSWFLSLWQPQEAARIRHRSSAKFSGDQLAGAPAPAAPAESVAAEPEAAVEASGTSVTLAVPRAVSVPSDGEAHQAPIGSVSLSVTPRYRVVPRVNPFAYLEVEARHSGPWPLLPGPVKAFVGGDYVGTSPLEEHVSTGEAFALPMGVDQAIEVKRERLAKTAGASGLIGKRNFAEYRYEVGVANHKNALQTVTVIEPMPQGTHEDVRISLLDPNHPPSERKPGELRWELKLAPHEKKVVRWGYRVEYPLGAILTGLE